MNSEVVRVVFFDIGDTLGTVKLSPALDRIERIDVLPGVAEVVQQMRSRDLNLGIISNRGAVPEAEVKRALEGCGLFGFFDPELLVYGIKDSGEIFLEAASRAGCAPQACLFVGENQAERGHAAGIGMKVAADPRSALQSLGEGNRARGR